MIRKNSDYYITSLGIVKDFIRTVTIVDDKAQFITNEYGSSFDAGRIIKRYAEDGKICSVFRFTEKDDVEKIIKITRESDITILDWKIELKERLDAGIEKDDELEEDEVKSKGFYTLEILKGMISSEPNPLKLIVIYTDEPAFVRISDEIMHELKDFNIKPEDGNPFAFYCNNNKITLFGKEELKGKTAHLPEVAKRSYNFEELPEAIYDEFLRFTHGIVAGIFLKAIASIRTHTFLLLNTFHRVIDTAFITHKGLLPIPDDAHDHIGDLIGSEIKSVINGTLDDVVINRLIDNYIDTLDENHLLECTYNGVHKKLSAENMKSLISDPEFKKNLTKSSNDKLPNSLPTSIIKANNPSLSDKDAESRAYTGNIQFAKLTTFKNRYLDFNKPILTLGVVLKDSEKDEYWICVQPKCDSIRISENENNNQGRAFLFLRLSKIEKGEIIFDADTRFKVEYSIKKSKQFLFKPTGNGMVTVREKESNHWFFMDCSGRCFDYLCELKNDFSQRIINIFASKISRVAVNHSEWLRLQVKNHE